MDCDAVVESWDLLANSDSEVDLETVDVTGDVVSLIGDVGKSRSLEPDESFVLFFFKNPRVGIEAALKECTQPWLDLGAAASFELGQSRLWNTWAQSTSNNYVGR